MRRSRVGGKSVQRPSDAALTHTGSSPHVVGSTGNLNGVLRKMRGKGEKMLLGVNK